MRFPWRKQPEVVTAFYPQGGGSLLVSANHKKGRRPDALARFEDGILAQKNGDHARAVALFSEVRALEPSWFMPAYEQGVALEDMGREDLAEVAYSQTLELQPDWTHASFNLGRIWKKRGDYRLAAGCFLSCVKYDPTDIDALMQLSICFAGMGLTVEEDATLRRLFELPGLHDVGHLNYGINRLREGNKTEARQHLALIANDPGTHPDVAQRAKKFLSAC